MEADAKAPGRERSLGRRRRKDPCKRTLKTKVPMTRSAIKSWAKSAKGRPFTTNSLIETAKEDPRSKTVTRNWLTEETTLQAVETRRAGVEERVWKEWREGGLEEELDSASENKEKGDSTKSLKLLKRESKGLSGGCGDGGKGVG